MLSTVPGKDALKNKSARRFGSLIINAAAESINKPERDQQVVRYASTNQLLTSCSEKGDSRVKFARSPASLELWLELPGAETGLESAGDEEVYLPLNGSRYLLNGRSCPDQTGHIDIEV